MQIRAATLLRSLALLPFGLAASPLAALAQDETSPSPLRVERPRLPGWSSTGDDGAAALWVNPANLALDPDPSWMVLLSQQTGTAVDQGRHFAMAGNLGPLAAGIQSTDGPDGRPWWTVSSGVGIRLDRTLALGGHLGWQLPEGPDNNFLAGDLSLAWRPTPWLGASVGAWNFGRWNKDTVGTSIVPGVVFRPWEDHLLLGAEYELPVSTLDQGILRGTARIQGGEGWVVRLSGDQTGRVGAGFELYWGPTGVGGFYDTPVADAANGIVSVYGRTPPGKRPTLSLGPKVARFTLEESFPYRESSGFFATSGETYLHLLSRLDRAANDPTLAGVVLHLKYTPFSMAQVDEIRDRIARMKVEGKKVIVYLDRYPDNRAYFLATAADEVYLHPAGDLELVGLSTEMQYFRGTLDLLGIEPQVARRSEYKSAPEGLMRTESSGPAREQMNELLDDLIVHLKATLAADRGWDVDQVSALIDEGPYTADEALEKKLVDGLCYPDELDQQLERLFTDKYVVEDDYGSESDTPGWNPRREIAVVTIDGGIVSGESSGPGFFGGGFTAGADTITEQLDAAAQEDTIKAVVLRVDSPGGSSFASDEIWRAVDRVKKAGKPVVVSMGSVAASGGYYVAANADAIYANPSTITGSIGVYAGPKLSLAGLYDKVGIGTEIYTRGRNAAMWSSAKPMDEHEFAALDRMVAHTYAQFKSRVGDGRGLSEEQVERVARGRVWSGTDAKDGGLVDELGTFFDAIERAKVEAGIEEHQDYSVVRLYSRGGGTGDVYARPLESLARPTLQTVAARLPLAFKPAMPALPTIPGLEAAAQYQRFGDETVLMLMPYLFEVQ